jgi:hypothetical protein
MSRRTLLRGIGAGVLSLPFLRAERANAEVPTKLLLITASNGFIGPEYWTPTGSGNRRPLPSSLPEIMRPLEGHQDDLLMIDGLMGMCASTSHGHNGGGPMFTGTANLFWNSDPGVGEFWAGGPSIDQFIGERLDTVPLTLASLAGGTRNDGYTRVIYAGANRPVAPIEDPRVAFEQVFGSLEPMADETAANRRELRRRSILDAVARDLSSLRSRLPSRDFAKLDGHLEAIRRIERELEGSVDGAMCAAPDVTGSYDYRSVEDYPKTGRLMMDIAVEALACGSRRIASVQLNNPGGGIVRPTWPSEGIDIDYTEHQIHHHFTGDLVSRESMPTPAVAHQQRLDLETWYFRQFRYLLDRLAEDRGGERLLDSTIVLYAKPMGLNHRSDRLLHILAGNRAGGLRTGRFLNYGTDRCGSSYNGSGCTPHNHLLVAICRMMGLTDVESFGGPDGRYADRANGVLDLS